MAHSIQFQGAARTVTGTKHLLRVGTKQILLDCGSFQGARELRDRNWEPFNFDPGEIDAVVLSHAHQDHIGMLPKLVKDGYRGPIYCTKATRGLCAISLPDSGRIQEEDAYHANKRGSRHQPALPLYTEQDAYAVMKQLKTVPYHQFIDLPGGVKFRYFSSGHILGSAFIELYFENGQKLVFSGDLGRYDTPIIKDPEVMDFAEFLVIESTYGDKLHPTVNPEDMLAEVIHEAVDRHSALLVPSFAIGRTQELLYHLRRLQLANRIPRIPIYVDSPMATSTSDLYGRSNEEWDDEMSLMVQQDFDPIEPEGLQYVRDRNMSKALNVQQGPMVVIAGSGMANGGRIQHHLLHRLSDPDVQVLFTGYQATETLGRRLLDGADRVWIFGNEVEVRAKISRLTSLSAHADQGELMRWLSGFKSAPKKTFIVHGEPEVQDIFAAKLRTELGWEVAIPEHMEEFSLDI